MDEENVESWAAQPDVCRCCLSASGSWDATTSYISDSGVEEVFADMLLECYNITLSHLSEWGPSHLVCALCVGRLRDASAFRKQVLRAEKKFGIYFNYRNDSEGIKIEDQQQSCDGFANNFDAANEVPDIEEKAMITSTVQKEEAIKKIKIQEIDHLKRKKQKTLIKKRKRNKIKIDIDYDSDVPIAELTKKKELSGIGLNDDNVGAENLDQLRCETKENDLRDLANKIDISSKGHHNTLRPKIVAKQISERKRVIVTCGTVLRDTTACPFRHHKSWFQCFFCTQEFMEINLLRHHTLENHQDIEAELKNMKRYPRSLQIDISNLQCRHCNINLIDVESMRHHFENIHNKIIYNESIADYKVNVSPYCCHICQQEFHVFRTLTTHLNEHYANCICDVCGRSFINSKRLKVHKRTHESGQFPCTECGKILKTKSSKANHMESAHAKRIIKCQICFLPMKHYNDRIKHMSEVHNITHKFKCTICSKEYNIKHYLATHVRQTHGNKNKKCSNCGMAFITNHGLKKHMVTHTGEKPYSCSVCNKSYARSYTLREHMRAHAGDARFLCPE